MSEVASVSGRTASVLASDHSFNGKLERLGQQDNTIEMKVPPLITKIFFQMHQGLFGLLFALQKKTESSENLAWFYIREIFEMLQFLSFPFRQNAKFPWNSSHTSWFIVFVNGTVPEQFLAGSITVFYVVIVFLALVLLNAAVVGYFFSQGQYRFVWTLRYLRFICTLFITILYIPVLGLFTSMLHDCGEPEAMNGAHALNLASCWTDLYALRSAAVLIVGIIYAGLSLTFCLSVFEQDPANTSERLNRPHSRIELYQLVVKTILAISFVIFESHVEFRWMLTSFCLVASISTFFLYVWYSPSYRWAYNMVRVQAYAIFAWASICLLLVCIIDDAAHNSVTIMFFVVLPCIMLIASYLANLRKNYIKSSKITSFSNPCTVELKARFILEDAGLLFKSPGHPRAGAEAQSDADKAAEAEVLKQVTQLYTDAAALLPNSSTLYMFWSIFSLYHCQNKQRSLVLLAECEKRGPLIDEKFVVFRQRKVMNEEASSENTDMLEFIICESYMKKAVKHEHKAVMLQLQFWTELCQKTTDLEKLFGLGTRINAEVSIADMNFSKALTSNPKSTSVLRSYSKFLIDVCNDMQKSEELHDRANQIEDLKRRTQALNETSVDVNQLMSDVSSDSDTAIFTINHKGIILSASKGVKTLFGYEKPQMFLGQNISTIVPAPFNKIHDTFLSKYLNVGEGNIISQVRKVFAMKADGYMIPALLLVRQLTFGTTATFLGIFKPVPEGTYSYSYIILDENCFIKGFTEKCTTYFGNTPADVARYQMHITQWIENFHDVSELMKGSSGYRMQLETEERVIDLYGTLVPVVIAGISLSILKLVDSNAKVFTSAAQNAEVNLKTGMPLTFYVQDTALTADKDEAIPEPKKDSKTSFKKQSMAKVAVDSAKKLPSTPKSPEKAAKKQQQQDPHELSRTESQVSSMTSPAEVQSQKTSGSQSSFSMHRMIRSMFTKRIDASSQRLETLQRVLVFLLFLLCALAVVSNFVVYNTYSGYVWNFQEIVGSGNNLVNSVVVLEKLNLLSINGPSMSLDARTSAAQEIIALAANISDTHMTLFNHSAAHSADLTSMFTTANLTIQGPYGVLESNLSLNDVVNRFRAQSASKAADMIDLSKSTDISGPSSIVLDTLTEPLKTLVLSYLNLVVDQRTRIPLVVYLVSVGQVMIVDFVLLALLIVIFIRTNAESRLMYKLFLDIPKDAILTMHTNCTKKLLSLDVSEVVDGHSLDEKAAVNAVFDIEGFIKSNAAGSSLKKSSMKMRQREIQTTKHSEMTNFKRLLVRCALLLVLTNGYFVGFSVYAHYYVAKYETVGPYLAWVARSWHATTNAHYRATSLYSNFTVSTQSLDFESKLASVWTAIQEVGSNKDALLYGDDAYKLKYFLLSMQSTTFNIDNTRILPLTMDAYPTIPAYSDKCVKLMNGVMNHGLYNSLAQYVELLRDVMGAVRDLDDPTQHGQTLFSTYKAAGVVDTMALTCLPEYFSAFLSTVWSVAISESFVVNNYAHITSTALLIVFIAAFYKFSMSVLLKHMKYEIALTPSMLLMFPPQVLMRVDSIKAFTVMDKR